MTTNGTAHTTAEHLKAFSALDLESREILIQSLQAFRNWRLESLGSLYEMYTCMAPIYGGVLERVEDMKELNARLKLLISAHEEKCRSASQS